MSRAASSSGKGGVAASGRPGEARPDLLEPLLVVGLGDDAKDSGRQVGGAVTAGLSLHQDEFDVILDNGVGFVGLAQEGRPVSLGLELRVGDLVPNDRGQVVEADGPTMFLDRSMEGYYGMPAAVLAAGKADVPNDTDQPPAGHERIETAPPNPVQFLKELLVVGDEPELFVAPVVLLQRPVRRRGENQMNTRRSQRHLACVQATEVVRGRNAGKNALDRGGQRLVLGYPRDVLLGIFQVGQKRREEAALSPFRVAVPASRRATWGVPPLTRSRAGVLYSCPL